jgi:hypothetical protein
MFTHDHELSISYLSSMTTNLCSIPIRISKNNREIDPTEDERQGIVQNITKQAYWHVSSCKPGEIRVYLLNTHEYHRLLQVMVSISCSMIILKHTGNQTVHSHI